MSGNQTGELVFCHLCTEEWSKDERGLQCPSCGSDIVEIIAPDANPLEDYFPDDRDLPHDHTHDHHHHHHHHHWAGDAPNDAPDPDEDDISRVEWTGPGGARFMRTTMRSETPGGRMPPDMADAFAPMFGSLMGSFPPPNVQGSPGNGRGNNATRTLFGGNTRMGTTYTFSVGGPGGARITRSSGNVGLEDLNGIMGQFFGMLNHGSTPGSPGGTTRGAGEGPGAQPFPPMMRMLMELLPPLTGSAGDVAYTQEAYDRILTALRDQHQGSNAPGPASEAAITALPKIKISKDQLDEQGKADCSICMDSVEIGSEVTQLPCSHWFHGECVASWLKEHDTCPQCRRGITPQDGDQNTPRTTGQAPRYWQVNEADVNALAREASLESQPGSSHSRRRSGGQSSRHSSHSHGTSSTRSPRRDYDSGHSSHHSGQSSSRSQRRENEGREGSRIGSIAGSIMRRFGGGGSGNDSRH